MRCIIIEDQLPAQRILKKYIEDLDSLELVATYTDALQAMNTLNFESIDILFLDIHLPKLSGMDFLKSISKPPQIILTTAFPDYALESYELNVVDYLLKPFSFQRFIKAVSKVSSKINTINETSGISDQSPTNEIFIKSGYEHIKINVNDIVYINSDADYTEVNLFNIKYISSESLKYWENKLNDQKFIRIHKSYIINFEKVLKVKGNKIFLTQNTIVPIGRTYKNIITKRFIK